MWVVINDFDRTKLIPPESITLQYGLTDTLATASFSVKDDGSSLNLICGQDVIIWDETAPFDRTFSGRIVETVPADNRIVDGIFHNGSTNWTNGGVNSTLPIILGTSMTMTYANVANTATGYIQQKTLYGYIQPGQKYMLSVYITGSNTPTNIQAFITINWQDVSGLALGSATFLGSNPVSTTQIQYTVSGVAPANAAFAVIQVGSQPTVSGTNSGKITFASIQFEPMWFPNKALVDGSPVTYPTPDCNFAQVTSVLMPDGTCTRMARLFTGTIKNLEATYQGTNRVWTVDCGSSGDLMENGALINKGYSSQTDVFMINDIISTYYTGLLSTGQQNVAAPASTITTGETTDKSFADITLREVLNQFTADTSFGSFVDPYGYVHYNPIPFDYALLTINVESPDYVTSFPPQDYDVTYDGTQIRNSVKVIGGEFQAGVEDTFNGDGTTKVFNLTSPLQAVTQVTVGGTKQKIGVQGQQTNGVGGIQVLSDAVKGTVTFNTAPASGTNNIVVDYNSPRKVTLLLEENSSIAQFGRKYQSKINDSSLVSLAAAKLRGEAELATWAFPIINLKFKLTNQFVLPGSTLYVTSALDGFTNKPFVVQTLTITSLGGGVDLYDYTAGIYRPTLLDHHRNTQKAVARSTDPNTATPIQVTYEIVSDTIQYAEQVNVTNGTFAQALYSVAFYGASSFN